MLKSLKLLHPTTELPSKTGTPPDCPVPRCPVASAFASEVRLATHLQNRHHPISEDLASVHGPLEVPGVRQAPHGQVSCVDMQIPTPASSAGSLPAAAWGPPAANLFSRPHGAR